jgi:ureidoglycolate hydrolase
MDVNYPSGFAEYPASFVNKVSPRYEVPVVTDIEPYGRYGESLKEWKGTGEVAEGRFDVYRDVKMARAHNHGVGSAPYITGLYLPNGDLLVREMNRHPDGEQMFASIDNMPFRMLVAAPSEELCPENVVVLELDGSRPFYIHRNTWHQPPYPMNPNAEPMTLFTAQAKSHQCVAHDFINRNDLLLQISC